MEESEIVSVVMQELSQGVGGIGNEQATEVSRALDYYLARLPAPNTRKRKDNNASNYVSTDVMDAIEATTAEIMPMFADEQLALFNPSQESDVDQAELESNMLNYLFINEYDGYMVLQSLVKDALLNRNCAIKVAWDERAVVAYENYDHLTTMGVNIVMQPNEPDEQVDVIEQGVDGEEPIQPVSTEQAILMELGEVPSFEETYMLKIRRTRLVGSPDITSIAPEELIVASDLKSPLIHDARFVAHAMMDDTSSLIAQGFDPEIVKQLPAYSDSINSDSRDINYTNDNQSASDTTRLIQIYDCYIKLDVDGDGIAELRHIILGGMNTLLLNEPVDSMPIIGGCATMIPHAYQGVSLFDRLKSIQDAKTPLVRSIIDGTLLATNPRLGVVNGQANIDDILTSVTGGLVRAENANAVFAIPNPEVPQSSYQMLGFMDAQRSEKGGSAITTATAAQSISGDSAHAVERTMSAMELSNALVGKTIAETVVRGLFLQLHRIVKRNYKGAISAKIGGQWVQSDPSSWRDRANVTIQVGSSQGERRRRSGVMTKIGTVQAQLAAEGSVLFSEEKLYDTLADGARLDGVSNPERYYVDPGSREGQQAKQSQEKQSQEDKAKQDEMQTQMIEAQQQLAQAELMKGQAVLQSQQAKLMVEQAKIEITQQKLDSANVIAVLNIELDQAKQDLDTAKATGELEFRYHELETKAGLELTKMEVRANENVDSMS